MNGRGRGVVFWLLAGVAGCGLADYEAKMAEAEKRLQPVDRHNGYLGDPLKVPRDRVPAGVELYLRAPRGINLNPLAQTYGPHLIQFRGRRPWEALYLACVRDKKQEDFWNDILATFPGLNAEGFQAARKQPVVGAPLTFQENVLENPTAVPPHTLLCYFHEQAPYQVALIYQVDSKYAQDSAAEMRAAIDASLQSLRLIPRR